MFASVRRYRGDSDQIDELMHRIDMGFAEQISREPGFAGYQAIDCGDGIVVTVTCFEDQGGAEASNERSAEWIAGALTDMEIERLDVHSGEVMVSRAQAQMLEPAHH